MADVKISALPAAASALGADEIPVNEAGTTKKVTITQIKTLLTPLGLKAGQVLAGSFSGTPLKATVTFGAAFGSSAYAIVITGIDARLWTYESKGTGGFVINANADAALTGEVSWHAILTGET